MSAAKAIEAAIGASNATLEASTLDTVHPKSRQFPPSPGRGRALAQSRDETAIVEVPANNNCDIGDCINAEFLGLRSRATTNATAICSTRVAIEVATLQRRVLANRRTIKGGAPQFAPNRRTALV